jgi:HAE1 family hydrophobic/amphiphilic exporter-1
MTLSLAAVFIPVLFMGGILGRLFHEFAAVIMVAILISGFVSLSLTPMLCSRFMKPPSEKHNALYRASERFFDGLRDLYEWTLRVVIRHRFITLMVAAGTLVATVLLYRFSPKDSSPTRTPISWAASPRCRKRHPSNRWCAAAKGGRGDRRRSERGRVLFAGQRPRRRRRARAIPAVCSCALKPRAERKLTPEQIIEELRPKLNAIPGIRTYLRIRR